MIKRTAAVLEEALERVGMLAKDAKEVQESAEKTVEGIHATIGNLTAGFSLTAPQGGPGVSIVLGTKDDSGYCSSCGHNYTPGLVATVDEARGLLGWLNEHVGSNRKKDEQDSGDDGGAA